MNWLKAIFGIKKKKPTDAEIDATAKFYMQKRKESPYRTRTIFDIKFGSLYNTGPFHTKMPEK